MSTKFTRSINKYGRTVYTASCGRVAIVRYVYDMPCRCVGWYAYDIRAVSEGECAERGVRLHKHDLPFNYAKHEAIDFLDGLDAEIAKSQKPEKGA